MTAPATSYESLLRRSEVAIPGLLGVLLAGALGFTLALGGAFENETRITIIIATLAAALLGIVMIVTVSLRIHRWTVTTEGIRIEERPKVPLTGRRRRVSLRFDDVAALYRLQSGFDVQLELVARDGQRFRLAQAFRPDLHGVRVADRAGLAAFAAAIEAALGAGGNTLPGTAEGLSFWNRPAGLAVLAVAFAVTLAIGIGAVWSFVWVRPPQAGARSGQMLGILILLPIGAGYLLIRSMQRRRALLAAQRGRS